MNWIAIVSAAFICLFAPACTPCIAQEAPVDSTIALQQAIDNAYQAGKKSVVIPPGTYRVSADLGLDKRHCFVFRGMHDFEIDARGVTFVNTTRGRGTIDFLHCANITLNGLTIRHEVPAASQGTITQIAPDRRSLDVQISAGYPADIDDLRYFAAIPIIDVYEPHRDILKTGAPDIYIASIERLGATQFRFHMSGRLPASPAVDADDRVAWRGTVAAEIHLYLTSGMKITGVTMESSPGFCCQEEGGDGGNYYNYTVTYGPIPAGGSEKPLISSNADSFNSGGLRKGPTLWNCLFEGGNDDGIPISSGYTLVGSAEGNIVYLDMTHRPTDFKEYLVGDHVRFYDNLKCAAGEAVVTAMERAPDYPTQDFHDREERAFATQAHQLWYKLTLDRPVSVQRGYMASDADAANNGFLVHGCTVRNIRGHGMLINASNGVIEDSIVEYVVYGGITIGPAFGVWTQGDFARNLIIRNNTIRESSIVTPCNFGGVALSVAGYANKRYIPLPGGHRDITITGNTFEDNQDVNVLITSAQNVTIEGNRFVRPLTTNGSWLLGLNASPGALIWLTQDSGVTLRNNIVIGPGPLLKTMVAADGTVTGSGLTDGVTRK